MGRPERERREGIVAGTLLPYRKMVLLKRLRGLIRDTETEFGIDLTHKLLLSAMEAGRPLEERQGC